LLAVTFARRQRHAEVRDRVARIVAAGGWRLLDVRVSDRRLRAPAADGGWKREEVHTRAEAILPHAPQARGGGLDLQPYLAGLGDLPRWEVLILMPSSPGLRPLRHFVSPALEVTLVRAGGPYRYTFVRRDAAAQLPVLPLTHQEAPPTSAASDPARGRSGQVAAVVAIAAASGLAVFAFLTVRARHRPSTRRSGST
jgi:hypothetical protein